MAQNVFYFAYGSNMDRDRKFQRTGRIRSATRALLRGYRFAFDKRSDSGDTVYANIHPDKNDVVWGVLYRCTPKTLDQLDTYEGVAGGHYYRATVTVEADGNRLQEAITYIAGAQFITKPGRPYAEYLERILAGARAHQLPEDYIDRLKALASNAA